MVLIQFIDVLKVIGIAQFLVHSFGLYCRDQNYFVIVWQGVDCPHFQLQMLKCYLAINSLFYLMECIDENVITKKTSMIAGACKL
jgi:hypothetical protein